MNRRQTLKAMILAPFVGLLKVEASPSKPIAISDAPKPNSVKTEIKCNCGKPMPVVVYNPSSEQTVRYICQCGRGYSWVKWTRDGMISSGKAVE